MSRTVKKVFWGFVITLISTAGFAGVSNNYEGVDVLMVIDNSGSMQQEQQILSTEVFSLVDSLANPPEGSIYTPVTDIRIGVVSSDMGLQWAGEPGPTTAGDGAVPGCGPVGKDGGLMTFAEGRHIDLLSGEIPCVVGASNCPAGSECRPSVEGETAGSCYPVNSTAPSIEVECSGPELWIETSEDMTITELATKAACMVQLGTEGCGIEQQLAAAVAGVNSEPGFLREDRLLAVVIVTDEDDCSIASSDLFDSVDWAKGENDRPNLNVACATDLGSLTATSTIKEQLIAAKGGDESAVVFAAIAGVPMNEICSGDSANPTLCLEDPAMEYVVSDFVDPVSKQEYRHLKTACTREIDGNVVTEARPGRRYVELAKDFGGRGWIYSICNEDWSVSMNSMALRILDSMQLAEDDATGGQEGTETKVQNAKDDSGCSVSASIGRTSDTSASLLSILSLF